MLFRRHVFACFFFSPYVCLHGTQAEMASHMAGFSGLLHPVADDNALESATFFLIIFPALFRMTWLSSSVRRPSQRVFDRDLLRCDYEVRNSSESSWGSSTRVRPSLRCRRRHVRPTSLPCNNPTDHEGESFIFRNRFVFKTLRAFGYQLSIGGASSLCEAL